MQTHPWTKTEINIAKKQVAQTPHKRADQSGDRRDAQCRLCPAVPIKPRE